MSRACGSADPEVGHERPGSSLRGAIQRTRFLGVFGRTPAIVAAMRETVEGRPDLRRRLRRRRRSVAAAAAERPDQLGRCRGGVGAPTRWVLPPQPASATARLAARREQRRAEVSSGLARGEREHAAPEDDRDEEDELPRGAPAAEEGDRARQGLRSRDLQVRSAARAPIATTTSAAIADDDLELSVRRPATHAGDSPSRSSTPPPRWRSRRRAAPPRRSEAPGREREDAVRAGGHSRGER